MIEKFLTLVNINDYTLLSGDYLVNHVSAINVTTNAKSLTDFHQFLQTRNTPLFYVQAPSKVCKEDAIAFTRNFANKNADNLLFALRQTDVFTFDLRTELHRQGLAHHDLFFKTDPHWKPEAGLWVANVIAECLNASFDFDIDTSLFDFGRYNYQVQYDFLGSIGRRASLAVVAPELITFIFPKFNTDLTIRIPSRKLDQRGDFHVIYNEEARKYALRERDVYKNGLLYEAYSWGNNPVTFLHNNQLKRREKKILIIRDSFDCVVTPFLILGVDSIDTMDIRAFTGSVQSFIEQHLPDIVIILYSPETISIKAAFDFR
jgi:hypothetical protein